MYFAQLNIYDISITDIVALLLKHKCSVDSRTETGNTAIHAASFGNKAEIMNLVIDAGKMSCLFSKL